jgi:hypothetical protein
MRPVDETDRRVRISTLWVVVMFNVLAADILSFIQPGFLAEAMTGYAGGVQITNEFLLVAAVLLEIPIAMVFLTRVLPSRPSRLANLGAVVITAAFVIAGGSLSLHYIFLVTMEVIAMALIAWYAWTWRSDAPAGAGASPSRGDVGRRQSTPSASDTVPRSRKTVSP